MKKITFKISAFLLLTFFGHQVQGQAFPGVAGAYQIKVQGENLYLTQSTTSDAITYEAEIPGSSAQVFDINNHPDGDFFSITSGVPGKGVVEVLDIMSASSGIGSKSNVAGGAGQQDKWNPTRGSGTQIFLESSAAGTAWDGSAKRRLQGFSASGAAVIGGGAAVAFDFIPLGALSTQKFDASSMFISNPVSNQISIKGLTPSINTVTIYSLLGTQVLSSKIGAQSSLNIDATKLTSGMYIVVLSGEGEQFTKKIIKQ